MSTSEGPDVRAAGFPERTSFHGLYFNAASGSVVVRCRDRSVGHPGGMLFHRRAGASRYIRTVELAEGESVDSEVVALDVPVLIAKVNVWSEWGGTWGSSSERIVKVDLSAPEPWATELTVESAPWAFVSQLMSLSGDGRMLYCRAAKGEPFVDGSIRGTHMRYGIYRWALETGEVEQLGDLPGIAF